MNVTPLLDPLRVLITCDWLSAAAAADPRVQLDSLIRSHQVVRVIAPDGRAVIVKQPTLEARQSGRTLNRELYVYRLAGWVDALAQLLPKPLLIDEMRQLLVCESLSSAHPWPDAGALDPLTAPGVAAQLGRAMAQWQRATQDLILAPSPAPGMLSIVDGLELALVGRSESAQAFLRSVTAESAFCALLREGAALYQPVCLIHGDIRPDNWAVQRDTTPITLKLFDWELAGLGDPAWDVGSVCAEASIQLIRSDASTMPDASGWPVLAAPVLREFLAAYAAAQGSLDVQSSATWDRVTLMAAARLLHVASEWAEYPYNIDTGGVDRIVAQARNLVRMRHQAAAALAQWAQA